LKNRGESKASRLDCLERRNLMNSREVAPEELVQIGRAYAEAGFLSDAVDFWAMAEDKEGLQGLLIQIIDEGDFFLYRRIKKILNQPFDPSDLGRLAENAERLGKYAFAQQAQNLAASLAT